MRGSAVAMTPFRLRGCITFTDGVGVVFVVAVVVVDVVIAVEDDSGVHIQPPVQQHDSDPQVHI